MAAASPLLRLATVTALCAASAAGLVTLAAPAGAVTSDASAYLTRLNQERTDHGLRALTLRTDLTSVAQRWANHMAAAGTLSHNPSLATQVTNWQVVGENVGEGSSIASLTTAFWNSAPHRDNILDASYRDVGIGTASANGVIWITVDFRDPETAEPASTIATRPAATTPVVHHVSHPTLRMGSRGRAVKRVQRRLHVAADGIFGRKTRHAVVRFQHRHHLHANGIVGKRTWKALHV